MVPKPRGDDSGVPPESRWNHAEVPRRGHFPSDAMSITNRYLTSLLSIRS